MSLKRIKHRLTASVDYSNFKRFDKILEKYLPYNGEGDNMAQQAVTAANKLIYKWYNDGDVFDNVRSRLDGWANDLSSYANWMYKYLGKDIGSILDEIDECITDSDYEDLLESLAYAVFNEDLLESLAEQPSQGSIYDEQGPFSFREISEDEDEGYDEYEEEYYEEDFDSSRKTRKSGKPLNSTRARRRRMNASAGGDFTEVEARLIAIRSEIDNALSALPVGDLEEVSNCINQVAADIVDLQDHAVEWI